MGVAVADGVNDGQEERAHELRAALFGIEASAEGLRRHRDLLTDEQLDELTNGLADEVRRGAPAARRPGPRPGHVRSRRGDQRGIGRRGRRASTCAARSPAGSPSSVTATAPPNRC